MCQIIRSLKMSKIKWCQAKDARRAQRHYPMSTISFQMARNAMKMFQFSLSKYTLVSSHCVYAETKPISRERAQRVYVCV